MPKYKIGFSEATVGTQVIGDNTVVHAGHDPHGPSAIRDVGDADAMAPPPPPETNAKPILNERDVVDAAPPRPPSETRTLPTAGKASILFFAANPDDTTQLKLDKEARDIKQKIRASEHRDFFSLETRWAVTADDLLQAMLEEEPGVVHFSGHGEGTAGIVLHGENGGSHLVKADALKRLFKAVGRDVRVVVLNACYSEAQARAIAEVVDCVVGMRKAVSDEAARKFAASFYRGLGFGGSVQDAFDQGLVAIGLHDLGEEDVPQLLVKEGVDAKEVILAPGPR